MLVCTASSGPACFLRGPCSSSPIVARPRPASPPGKDGNRGGLGDRGAAAARARARSSSGRRRRAAAKPYPPLTSTSERASSPPFSLSSRFAAFSSASFFSRLAPSSFSFLFFCCVCVFCSLAEWRGEKRNCGGWEKENDGHGSLDILRGVVFLLRVHHQKFVWAHLFVSLLRGYNLELTRTHTTTRVCAS